MQYVYINNLSLNIVFSEHIVFWKTERVGVVQLGEEKASGGPARKLERDFLQGPIVTGQGVMALDWMKVDLD